MTFEFETPDDVLEHFGVRGMKWGVRKAGSGARATGRFVKRHPRGTAVTVAGAALAAGILTSRGSNSISSSPIRPFAAAGKNWTISANDGHTFEVLVKNLAQQGK